MADDAERDRMRAFMAHVAPGTMLREAVDRIIGGGRGALIVVGWGEDVERLVSGGFVIDTNATAQRIAELAKMDGAMILDGDAQRVLRANVHLVPSDSVPTSETGTRHRTAERVARQCDVPVISVSESMSLVTLYLGDQKRRVEDVATLLYRANGALATLERYRTRLGEVTGTLSFRELADEVTLRDVCTAVQRFEMVRRIAEEVDELVAELGRDGRLIELQRAELMSGVDDDRRMIVQDYLADRRRRLSTIVRDLESLSTNQLLDLSHISGVLAYDAGTPLDTPVDARGHRLLSRIPRLPKDVVDRIVARFGTLVRIVDADLDELQEVEGVGEQRAMAIRSGLARLQESSQMDRPL